jgi:hypothetical protein
MISGMVKITAVEHAGLAAIELVERRTRLVIVHGVGPRIAWFGALGGDSLLFWDDEGRRTRGSWRLYGGHRLWTTRPDADESEETYLPDNEPCRVRALGDGVAVIAAPDRSQIERTIAVRAGASGWRIEHRLRNVGDMLWSGGAWALTCTLPRRSTQYRIPLGAPRGTWDVFTMVVPRRWGGGHTSRIADPQFRLGDDAIAIRARGEEAKRMVFAPDGVLEMRDPARGEFTKRAAAVPGAEYPCGTNLAVYLGPSSFMVELETMSPIVKLAPGEALRHVEHWSLRSAG